MGTRILVVVLFILSVLTSSAITFYMVSKVNTGKTGDLSDSIAQFIEKNPEVIIQSLRKAQQAREDKEASDSEKAAMTLRPKLEQDASDPSTGSKDADVTMVGFIDHNCGYCKKSLPDIEKLLSEDKSFRFVLKDFPILGPVSVEKAKASIAIAKIAPDKWYSFYDKLAHSNTQTVEQVIDLAHTELGIDPNQLKSEMESKETENKLSENRALGEQLMISGTPVFIVNGKVLRGALGYDAFKDAVDTARANKS